ncbi:unnamed protein product [Kuraishia capsulata CBS 1993]|uniref:U3 small nucleolar RNA-associated protein 15 C-terminal domain-containing protein n=1 Tax=Kuraishia capsulata CBS 1993 TaxID=1382522 RepID=W6MUW2_9ASCO|nr:uncharacterized protein KUCA_T00005580001 [Kuraishia capsulata CBS 1993]CDK29587.1 unnamed protein product [Kuraishia capsulata CBS 1993]
MSSVRQRVPEARNPTLPAQSTPEQRYWRGFVNTQLVKEHNAVTHIHFNPVSPHDFAVTSSTRIQIFSSKTRQVIKTFSRFKDTVYSGEFRDDGKLLVAGDATGLVQIFDAYQPKSLLVTIKPTSHPVHVTKFNPTVSTQLLTASDDRCVRLYDISNSAAPLLTLDDHSDYVRTASFIPGTSLIATGCYDGYIRLFDPRSGDKVAQFNQQDPVEDLLSLSPTSLVSCGGPSLKVWDLSAGKSFKTLTNFAKTVTCLSNAGERGILAGSIDGHVKVFDSSSPEWQVTFGWKFGNGVMSCGVSPNHKHFVAGLNSGLLAVRTRKIESTKSKQLPKEKSNAFARMLKGSDYLGEFEHQVINDAQQQQKKLRQFEKDLNSFKWSDALNSAFVSGLPKEHTVAALEELKRRGKVRAALSDRDEMSLEPLLTWSLKAIEDTRTVGIVSDYVGVVLELYADMVERSPILEELLLSLDKKLSSEIVKAQEAQKIEGMLELLSV